MFNNWITGKNGKKNQFSKLKMAVVCYGPNFRLKYLICAKECLKSLNVRE